MYNYHGGKLVQRGPNPLSSHITVRLRSSRDIVYFVCIFFATHFFNFFFANKHIFGWSDSTKRLPQKQRVRPHNHNKSVHHV